MAKAAVFTGPRQVEVHEVEVATPAAGEIQVATMFSGISAGTEMNVYRGRAPQWQQRLDPATRLFARPAIGDAVVVSGLGVIGLLVTQLVRRAGAGLVVGVDRVRSRRDLAGRLGADLVLDPADGVAERVRAATHNRGADIVIEVS